MCVMINYSVMHDFSFFTLSAHAQRGLWYLVCVCVCVSKLISTLWAMMRMVSDRYKRLHCYNCSKNKIVIFLKQPCSSSRNWQCHRLTTYPNPSISIAHAYLYPYGAIAGCAFRRCDIKHKRLLVLAVCPFGASWRIALEG